MTRPPPADETSTAGSARSKFAELSGMSLALRNLRAAYRASKKTYNLGFAAIMVAEVRRFVRDENPAQDQADLWWDRATQAFEKEADELLAIEPNKEYPLDLILRDFEDFLCRTCMHNVGNAIQPNIVRTASLAPKRLQGRIRAAERRVQDKFALIKAALETEESPNPGQE
ncbi:MAG: hypothetical protein JKP92_04800 [Alphaproteobacteria bacterium]|nr:hypothetical protein [Alphaproteobacteria bacterium]